MTGHTKEPWRFDGDWSRLPSIVAGDVREKVIATVTKAGFPERNSRTPEQEANARRIVDCVNALAGMNPVALGALIEAAEGLAKTAEVAEHTDFKSPQDVKNLMDAADLVNAALAAFRGGAQ